MASGAHPLFSRLQAALGPQYRIERELGRGGMGVVFLANDTTLDRLVAVKVIHPELAVHASIAQRFAAEAKMIARLRHPNILAIHAAGEATGLFFYVMDYVPGESLRQRLNREGKLDPATASAIIRDLAGALHAAGQAGLVHRDVKPENVLLDSDSGRALLADFGIARAIAANTSSQITGQGIAVGTPTYMSPEQAAGEEVDSRSDLYALGVVAYEMLAGHPPFRGPNAPAIVSMQISERPTPIDRVRPVAAGPLGDAIMRSLEKDPAHRWQTGDEFGRALDGSALAPVRRSRRGVAIAAGLAIVAAAATGALAARGSSSPPEGTNPRHSMLILPFDNLRQDPAVEWLREGSVNMLGLNLSQWSDLTVVEHERVHDLLAKHGLQAGADIGLEMARRLAREAGAWTVVLGDFAQAADSLHLTARMFDVASGERVDLVRVDDQVRPDVRPMFDRLATQLLDLSGAPGDVQAPGLAQSTTMSVEAYRAYLAGMQKLNGWDLPGAEEDLRRAVKIDSTFGLAYYKLALTRGWISGPSDSAGGRAIRDAARYSTRAPVHDRMMINAYQAFIEGDYAASRAHYRQLLSRDSTDADAWYGLGDVAFHDSTSSQRAELWTESLRAFKRALALDPSYYLAFEHTSAMLNHAARERPHLALMSGDSFVRTHDPMGKALLDSATVAVAVKRARSEAVAAAQNWVASQPETPRAYSALIDAYVASQNYPAAMSQVSQLRQSPASASRPDLPFLQARVQLEAGDIRGSEVAFETALDSAVPNRFTPGVLPPNALGEVAAAANVFAYSGDLQHAERAIELADQVRQVLFPGKHAEWYSKDERAWRRMMLGHLYTSTGAPNEALRRMWASTAEEARTAPAPKRGEIAETGWIAAMGLFLGPTGEVDALTEAQALTGQAPPKEIQALLALSRQDSTEARHLLDQADADGPKGGLAPAFWGYYRLPLSAQAHYLLGDYRKTIELLKDFQPDHFETRNLDWRWGLLGRARLLRASAYEKLGQREAAKAEYRTVLSQWETADPALQPFVRQARAGLARVSGEG